MNKIRFIIATFIVNLIFIHPHIIAKELSRYDGKIAVVDVEAILEHSVAVKDLKSKISEVSQKIQQDLTQKEIELKMAEAELIKERAVLASEIFDKKLAQFNKQVAMAQQEVQRKRTNLEQAHNNAISLVHKTTIEIIKNLSEKNDFNIVIPSSQILFVKNNLNITDIVINELNEKLIQIDLNFNLNQPGK